jgi:hypothetical protein
LLLPNYFILSLSSALLALELSSTFFYIDYYLARAFDANIVNAATTFLLSLADVSI